MTFYAKNGSGDAWYYGRWEDEATYERYIGLLGGSDMGRYGRYCGWTAVEGDKQAAGWGHTLIDDNTTLITNVMLDAIEAADGGKSIVDGLVKLGDVSELEKLEDMQTGAFFDDFDEVLDDD